MKQNILYTKPNDNNRKDNNSKIIRKNTNLTSYNSSKRQAVGIISKITKTNFPYTKHKTQNQDPINIQNYTNNFPNNKSTAPTTIYYDNTLPAKSKYPMTLDQTKIGPNIMKQKNMETSKYKSNINSDSSKYTQLLRQHHISKHNDNIATPTHKSKQITTSSRESTHILKTNIIEKNGSDLNNKNDNISDLRTKTTKTNIGSRNQIKTQIIRKHEQQEKK